MFRVAPQPPPIQVRLRRDEYQLLLAPMDSVYRGAPLISPSVASQGEMWKYVGGHSDLVGGSISGDANDVGPDVPDAAEMRRGHLAVFSDLMLMQMIPSADAIGQTDFDGPGQWARARS
jgi:hypothetical protein